MTRRAPTQAPLRAASIPVNTALPTISGTPQVGQTLTATNGTWTNSPASFTYQWNRAGTPIAGATASTYVPVSADVGNSLTISVTGTNGSGSSTPATSPATSSVIDIIPTNLAVPTISGTARVGQTLTATLGTWSHSPTSFVYKWANSNGLIPGATQLTYVPTSADVGLILEIFVVATNSGGTSAVANERSHRRRHRHHPGEFASIPTISGTAQVGQTLTATTGTWTHNPTSFIYQWNRAGTAIGGATAATYVPVTGDIGNTLTVSVVATNSGGSSAPSTSAATGAVAAAGGGIPVITALPVISGTAQNGQMLTATNGTWTNSPTSFTYQWKSAGVNATGAGATTANYTADAADVGNTLTVSVIATNGSGSSTPATSSATSSVIDIIPVFVNYPIISGTAQVGQTLTTTPGVWTHNPTSYAYQWGNTASGGIAGATASTYVPVTSDIGFMLNVSVVATNSGGSSPAVTSAATGAVLPASPVIPVNTVVPTISGTPQVGQTLTATNGTWTNSPTSFTYQWNRAGTAIAGATASTYVPVSADVGTILTISVTATNGSGSSAPATSAATSSVIDIIPTNSALPMISGTAQVGQTLTTTTGTWMHNPASYACQWFRAGAAIAGATALTYAAVTGDIGNTLTVSIVATNSGGSSTPAISAATSAVLPASPVIPANTVVPTISGTPQVGQTLTATNGTWTNSPTSFTYQWNRAGTAIAGATASTYVPVSADVGTILTISVTATNGSGSSAPATSAATSAVTAAGQIIPPDRNFTWNPGMMSKGGIPNRTTIYATLSPSGGDDSAAIQAKLDSCPSGQVVMLNPGTFIVNNYVLIHSGITLRGSGAGVTILNKANGAQGRLSTVVPGTNGIHTPQSPSSYTYDTQPIVIVGPSRYPGPDNSTSQALAADGAQGSYSVTIANAAGFAAGQFVLLDEMSGASWQADAHGVPGQRQSESDNAGKSLGGR